jgi:hypothetical protein
MSLIWQASTNETRHASLAEAEARFLRERAGVDRKERLAAWREWAAKKLLADLAHVMPHEDAARARLIGQCTAELERMVRQLFDRGWLIEGKRLAEVVDTCLAPIAAAHRAGKVQDFWPHFRASVRRYVPINAEELQRTARRDGADAASAISGGLALALGMLTAPKAPSITEVIGERHAERVQAACKPGAKRGRPRKFQAATDATDDLFGGG